MCITVINHIGNYLEIYLEIYSKIYNKVEGETDYSRVRGKPWRVSAASRIIRWRGEETKRVDIEGLGWAVATAMRDEERGFGCGVLDGEEDVVDVFTKNS